MTEPNKDYLALAIEFKAIYQQIKKEIETFENIFKNKQWKPETRKHAKLTLKLLYKERDDNAAKAEHYREIYLSTKGTKRTLGWGKSRA